MTLENSAPFLPAASTLPLPTEQRKTANAMSVRRIAESLSDGTALGICTAILNQPGEVAAARPPFAAALCLTGLRSDLVVRFGCAPLLQRSLRQQVEAVMR